MRYVVGLGPYTFKRLCKLSVIPHLFEKGYSLVPAVTSSYIKSGSIGINVTYSQDTAVPIGDNLRLFSSVRQSGRGLNPCLKAEVLSKRTNE
jgi:hypothetical protein